MEFDSIWSQQQKSNLSFGFALLQEKQNYKIFLIQQQPTRRILDINLRTIHRCLSVNPVYYVLMTYY